MAEEEKNPNVTNPENAQTTIETGAAQENKTLSKEQNNTVSSTKNTKNKKKKKPSDLEIDSQNSLRETKNKFKNTYSSGSLK